MAIPFNDNIQVRAPKAIDDRWGVFESGVWRAFVDTQEVDDLVIYRHVGLTVLIQGDDGNEEWWFKDGTDIGDLVLKLLGESYTFGSGLTNQNNNITLGSPMASSNVGSIVGSLFLQKFDSSTTRTGFYLIDNTSSAAHTVNMTSRNAGSIASIGITGNVGPNKVLELYKEYGPTGARTIQSLLFKSMVDNSDIVLRDDVGVGFRYHEDYSANGILIDRWIPDWGAVKGYVDDLGLQKVTDKENQTSNSVNITGSTGLAPSVQGLKLYKAGVGAGVYNLNPDGLGSAISFESDGTVDINVGVGSAGPSVRTSVSFLGETNDDVSLLVNGRAAGEDAQDDNDFVTFRQIQGLYTFENGLREDNGVVKLGLDLTTIGITNEGSLTEDTILALGDFLTGYVRGVNIVESEGVSIHLQTPPDENQGSASLAVRNGGYFHLISIPEGGGSSKEIETSNVYPGISITDSVDLFGMKYVNDYSTEGMLDDRWIPDWGSIKSQTALGSGLRRDSGLIKLGWASGGAGLLTETTHLFLGNVPGNNYNGVSLTSNDIVLQARTSLANVAMLQLFKNTNSLLLTRSIASEPQSLSFGPSTSGSLMNIVDSINSKGLEEDADYSANKTDYSYVTKKMLDEKIAKDDVGAGLRIDPDTQELLLGDREITAGIPAVDIDTAFVIGNLISGIIEGVTVTRSSFDVRSVQGANVATFGVFASADSQITLLVGSALGLRFRRSDNALTYSGLLSTFTYGDDKVAPLGFIRQVSYSSRLFKNSNATTLFSIRNSATFVYTGTVNATQNLTADWPSIAGTNITVINQGTGYIRFDGSIWDVTILTDITVNPGEILRLVYDGDNWCKL